MKKIIFCVYLLLSMSGCVILPKYFSFTESVDLTKYNSQDFFVTTGDLTSYYTPLEFVSNTSYSGFVPKGAAKKASNKTLEDDLYTGATSAKAVERYDSYYGPMSSFRYKFPDLDESFEDIIKKAQAVGANGLINVRIVEVSRIVKKQPSIGYKITGLAIKIE